MTRFTTLALTLAVAVSATGLIYAQPPDHRSYTQSEIKQMIRDAHTAQQYHDLATYFQGRQQYFEQQAQSEKIEWDRRSQITAASYQKYPGRRTRRETVTSTSPTKPGRWPHRLTTSTFFRQEASRESFANLRAKQG